MSRRTRGPSARSLKVTKSDIYRILIKLHHWTFDEVASLNRWQQVLAADMDFSKADDTVEFATMEEYLAWKESKDL